MDYHFGCGTGDPLAPEYNHTPSYCEEQLEHALNRDKKVEKKKNMGSEQFIKRAIALVEKYAVSRIDKTTEIPKFEVFEVWHCYILGNQKALLSTTLPDGMYYEVTYNAERDEIYFDAYKKFENICITDALASAKNA